MSRAAQLRAKRGTLYTRGLRHSNRQHREGGGHGYGVLRIPTASANETPPQTDEACTSSYTPGMPTRRLLPGGGASSRQSTVDSQQSTSAQPSDYNLPKPTLGSDHTKAPIAAIHRTPRSNCRDISREVQPYGALGQSPLFRHERTPPATVLTAGWPLSSWGKGGFLFAARQT